MAYSFVDIEQNKSRSIQWSIGFLFLLYFFGSLLIVGLVKFFLLSPSVSSRYLSDANPVSFISVFDGLTLVGTLSAALFFGLGHWLFAVHSMIDKTLQFMSARIADPAREEERIFCNIVEEASVATGNKYRIEPYIVPTSAMNAFAVQDFEGRSVIGITEGLLHRLNRSQLEAVIAHEAGHVVSGDCLETTVIMVVFGVFDLICDVSRRLLFFSDGGYRSRSSRRNGGQLALVLLIVFIVSLLLKFIGILGSMFVSREREYRADALAVKITRNPMALAEALYIISHKWKGSGIPGDKMEAMFILSPRHNALDNDENFFAELFSTHPPINKRIAILMAMAHGQESDLAAALQAAKTRTSDARKEVKDGVPERKTISFGVPLPVLDQEVMARFKGEGIAPAVKDQCPRCRVALTLNVYEGYSLLTCGGCGGVLLSEMNVLNIVGKREIIFDSRIKELARLIRQQVKPMKSNPFDGIYDEKSIICPSCLDARKRMTRRFVSSRFPIEVDKCKSCARVWFDKDELEIMQCLYEIDEDVKAGTTA